MIFPLVWELKGVCRIILRPKTTDYLPLLSDTSQYISNLIRWNNNFPLPVEDLNNVTMTYRFETPNAPFSMIVTADMEFMNPLSPEFRGLLLDHVIMCKVPFINIVMYWISHNQHRLALFGDQFSDLNKAIAAYSLFQIRHTIENTDGFALFKSLNRQGFGLSSIELDAVQAAKFVVFYESCISVASRTLASCNKVYPDFDKFIWIVHPDIPKPDNQSEVLEYAYKAGNVLDETDKSVVSTWLSDIYGDPYNDLDETDAHDFASGLLFLEAMHTKHNNMNQFWANFSVYNRSLTLASVLLKNPA